MTLTKIEAEIEILEGYEFNRIDRHIKDDCDYYQRWNGVCKGNPGETHDRPIIILRKIKPKKPAYRVYKDKNIPGTYTQDRDANGNVTNICCDNVEFITPDWIEYDPSPKKWPTQLVERIAAIDLDAAQWIVDNWDDLLEDKYTYKGNYSRNSERLDLMFDWEETEFIFNWAEISDKLGE